MFCAAFFGIQPLHSAGLQPLQLPPQVFCAEKDTLRIAPNMFEKTELSVYVRGCCAELRGELFYGAGVAVPQKFKQSFHGITISADRCDT